MTKSLGSSKLHLEEATFTNCEIIVLIWENGSEKTTLIRMLTGDLKIVPEEKDYYVFSWSNRDFTFRYSSFISSLFLKLLSL